MWVSGVGAWVSARGVGARMWVSGVGVAVSAGVGVGFN